MFTFSFYSSLVAVLFVQALMFLRLVRHGQPVVMSAAIAAVFAVTALFLVKGVHRSSDGNGFLRALDLRTWTPQQKRELLRCAGAALIASLLLSVADQLWPVERYTRPPGLLRFWV